MANKYDINNYIKEYNALHVKQDKKTLKDFIIEKLLKHQ